MPKSMPQPNIDSKDEYFIAYMEDQVKKVKFEMVRLNKRLNKIENAAKLYTKRFGKEPKLGKD